MTDCPICGNELDGGVTIKRCRNDCYKSSIVATTIFGEYVFNSEKERIQKLIEYWKENDRYLMRILAGK